MRDRKRKARAMTTSDAVVHGPDRE